MKKLPAFPNTATARRTASASSSAPRKTSCASMTRSPSWSCRWNPCAPRRKRPKRYLILRDELRSLEVSLWIHQLSELHAGALRLQSDFEAAQRELAAANEALEALYRYTEQFGEKLAAADEEAEQLRGSVSALDGQIGERESEIAVMENGIAHHEADMARIENELNEQSARTENLQEQMDVKRARIEEIDASCAALARELEDLLRQAEEVSGRAGSIADEAEGPAGERGAERRPGADIRTELSARRTDLQNIEERRAALLEEQAAVSARREETERGARESRAALEQAREERESVANVINGHHMRMESRRQKAKTAADQALKLTMERNVMESRIRLLGEMEKEYEGFSKAVRTVMQRRSSKHAI